MATSHENSTLRLWSPSQLRSSTASTGPHVDLEFDLLDQAAAMLDKQT